MAQEINKASHSIKTSIKKITSNTEEKIKISPEKQKEEKTTEELKEEILLEKKVVVTEKKKEEKVVLQQNKIAPDNLIGKTFAELTQNLGKPKLLREDGKTITVRFDTKNCRVFVYFNRFIAKSLVEHYELRNTVGELIDNQIEIKKCFEEIKLT